jgi:hypothetical protein
VAENFPALEMVSSSSACYHTSLGTTSPALFRLQFFVASSARPFFVNRELVPQSPLSASSVYKGNPAYRNSSNASHEVLCTTRLSLISFSH